MTATMNAWQRHIADDIAATLTGAPQASVVEGLLAMGAAFGRLGKESERNERAWNEWAAVVWERVWRINWPTPAVAREKRLPVAGPLSADALEIAQAARVRTAQAKKQWTDVGSPWGDEVQPGEVCILLLTCAARAAQPGPLGWRQWKELCAAGWRVWDMRAVGCDLEFYGDEAVVREGSAA